MKIYSFSPFGYEGALVNVEVDLRRGIPAVDMVGLADGAVKESRERMRSAIRNSGYEFPGERVLISLSPADLKKEGAGFDLAVALAVLQKKAMIDGEKKSFEMEDESILVMGELELNGNLRPVRGVHAAAATAVSEGIRWCIVPMQNADEAREIDGMQVYGAERLDEAFEALNNQSYFSKKEEIKEGKKGCYPEGSELIEGIWFPPVEEGSSIEDVKGQEKLVRALAIAAAGGHNLLAFGPPGCGKTLALQRFPSLLPLLTKEESQEVTRIYSIAGFLSPSSPSVRKKPFRMPHQSASIEGMCGGGIRCTPGEISLAHSGVLFLDEASEFRTSVLQMLRVPLESGKITLSRAGRSTVFPADFQLLMATNPCPCGNYGSREKICLCSAHSIEQYWRKFSAPLLDRIELRVHVELYEKKEELNKKSPDLKMLRQKIGRAIFIQRKRQGKLNKMLTPSETARFCTMSGEARKTIEDAEKKYAFSPRAVSLCIKCARTIADMEGSEKIEKEHMEEAVSFRKSEGGMGLNSSLL